MQDCNNFSVLSYWYNGKQYTSIIIEIICGCLPEMAVHAVSFINIYIPGQLGFISFLIVQSYGVHKHSSTWRPDGSTCLLAYYSTSLSLLCRCIWMYWTFKMLVRYILSSVCLILSQFSQLSFMIYMGLCVFSLPIYLMMILRICVLYVILIIKSEVWPICHCLRLGHEAMVGAVCLSILYIYIYQMDCVCQRYHKECSTRTCADDCYN